MEDLWAILSSIIVVVGLLYVVCLGWGIPFSFGKVVGLWAGIMLIRFIRQIIFD